MRKNLRHAPVAWLRYGGAELRAAVAEDRRLRRRAGRLRLFLEKARGVGGWTLSSRTDGAIICGPKAFAWQIAEALDGLLAEAKSEGLL